MATALRPSVKNDFRLDGVSAARDTILACGRYMMLKLPYAEALEERIASMDTFGWQ